MKKLPPIHGLLCAAAALRLQAERDEVARDSNSNGPRHRHDSGASAIGNRNKAAACDAAAVENVDMIFALNTVGDFLRLSKHGSALRTLALRKIEEAEMTLRREIGDAP